MATINTIKAYKAATSAAARAYYKDHQYTMKRDGRVKYADFRTVYADRVNVNFEGNSKTGRVAVVNLSVFYSCDHSQLCYPGANHDGVGACYGCAGNYNIPRNQVLYAENVAFFRKYGAAAFAAEVVKQCRIAGAEKLRFFTVGDFMTPSFVDACVTVARDLPGVRMWCYTKRILMFNQYIREHGGLDCIPSNFNVIYSLWTADAGVIPVFNPFNRPTAVFIPFGRERDLVPGCTYICPCASTDSVTDCDHCQICQRLRSGESVGFFEHSSVLTKARDAVVNAIHKSLRAGGACDDYERSCAASERIKARYMAA
jgi:hypothetical protein